MNVKSILTILLIAVFAGVLIFGTFAMNNDGSSYCYSLCVSAIKIFSTAVSGTISLLLLFIILVPEIMGLCTARPCKAFCTARPGKAQQELTHWLAIHENSPTVL